MQRLAALALGSVFIAAAAPIGARAEGGPADIVPATLTSLEDMREAELQNLQSPSPHDCTLRLVGMYSTNQMDEPTLDQEDDPTWNGDPNSGGWLSPRSPRALALSRDVAHAVATCRTSLPMKCEVTFQYYDRSFPPGQQWRSAKHVSAPIVHQQASPSSDLGVLACIATADYPKQTDSNGDPVVDEDGRWMDHPSVGHLHRAVVKLVAPDELQAVSLPATSSFVVVKPDLGSQWQ